MDPILLLAQLLLFALGAMGVASSDSLGADHYFYKHAINIAVALLATFLVSWAKPEWAIRVAKVLFLVTIVLLVAVLIINHGPLNLRRWIFIPGFPSGFQPSELAKLAVVFYLAAFFHNKPRDYPILGPIIAITLAAGLIVIADFDTGLFLLFLSGFMLMVIGVPWRRLGAIGFSAWCIVLAMSGLVMEKFERSGYIKDRLNHWFMYLKGDLINSSGGLNDGIWQIAQGHKLMIKAGLFGQGVGEPMAFPLASSQNDMIFASVVWAGGWLAGLMVLVAFWLILARGLQISAHLEGSKSVMAIGLMGYLVLQAASNIGVVIGFLPVSGSPLPLVSYGGSSMLIGGIAVGLLHALYREANLEEAEVSVKRLAKERVQ